MRSTSSIRSVRAALLVAFAGATLGASVAAAKPTRPRASRLFASAGYLFQVNQQVCGVDNIGEICVAFAGSPVGGGGFWPKGTPDQYIFNSGLQLAGIIRNSPFPHPSGSSDTVGAFFFDPRGDQAMGRSEEHTSELQSPCNLVCRLLLEKKKQNYTMYRNNTINAA